MPLGASVSGLDYFVWQNSSAGQGGPQGNPSWDYLADFGNALTSVTISSIPEPSTWAMMALGFAGLGLAGWRKTKGAAALAAR
jgi:PEP-CTERM motif